MILRLKMAWAVLRGHPVLYRANVVDGALGVRTEFGGPYYIVESNGGRSTRADGRIDGG